MIEISFLPEFNPVHSDVRDFFVWLVWGVLLDNKVHYL